MKVISNLVSTSCVHCEVEIVAVYVELVWILEDNILNYNVV